MPTAKGGSSESVNEVPPLKTWELNKLYSQGEEYFDKGRWKEAIGCFLKILRWDPEYTDVYGKLKEARRKEKIEDFFAKGRACCTEGTWQKADEMFSKVLELEPGHKRAVVEQAYARGMMYFGKEQWEDGRKQFKRVVEQDATRKDAIDKLKETSLILVSGPLAKRLDDAIKLLEEVREFIKDDVGLNTKLEDLRSQKRLQTLFKKGMDCLRAKKWQEAHDNFALVFKIDPEYRNVAALLKVVDDERTRLDKPYKVSEWFKKRCKSITVLGAIILKRAALDGLRLPSVLAWWRSLSTGDRIAVLTLFVSICAAIISCPFIVPIVARFLTPTTSTPTATFTPILTETLTPTVISSPPTHTPTITPTSIPSLTGTSAVTPTATPTPTPIVTAVVTAEALNLRVGPDPEYEIIRKLKGGDTLTVLGRTSKGDWLHVRTSKQEEGWVNAAYVDLDRNLDVVPTVAATPTLTLLDAPTPLSPLTEEEAVFVNQVKLQWRWIRPLAKSEYFSVRISRQDTGEVCCHDQTQNTVYKGSLVGCYSGKLFWEVAAVRLLSRDPEKWLELSQSSEPQLFDFEKE